MKTEKDFKFIVDDKILIQKDKEFQELQKEYKKAKVNKLSAFREKLRDKIKDFSVPDLVGMSIMSLVVLSIVVFLFIVVPDVMVWVLFGVCVIIFLIKALITIYSWILGDD